MYFDTTRDPAAPSIIGADQGQLLSVKRQLLVGLGDMKMGAREQCNMAVLPGSSQAAEVIIG